MLLQSATSSPGLCWAPLQVQTPTQPRQGCAGPRYSCGHPARARAVLGPITAADTPYLARAVLDPVTAVDTHRSSSCQTLGRACRARQGVRT